MASKKSVPKKPGKRNPAIDRALKKAQRTPQGQARVEKTPDGKTNIVTRDEDRRRRSSSNRSSEASFSDSTPTPSSNVQQEQEFTTSQQFQAELFRKRGASVTVDPRTGDLVARTGSRTTVVSQSGQAVEVPSSATVDTQFAEPARKQQERIVQKKQKEEEVPKVFGGIEIREDTTKKDVPTQLRMFSEEQERKGGQIGGSLAFTSGILTTVVEPFFTPKKFVEQSVSSVKSFVTDPRGFGFEIGQELKRNPSKTLGELTGGFILGTGTVKGIQTVRTKVNTRRLNINKNQIGDPFFSEVDIQVVERNTGAVVPNEVQQTFGKRTDFIETSFDFNRGVVSERVGRTVKPDIAEPFAQPAADVVTPVDRSPSVQTSFSSEFFKVQKPELNAFVDPGTGSLDFVGAISKDVPAPKLPRPTFEGFTEITGRAISAEPKLRQTRLVEDIKVTNVFDERVAKVNEVIPAGDIRRTTLSDFIRGKRGQAGLSSDLLTKGFDKAENIFDKFDSGRSRIRVGSSTIKPQSLLKSTRPLRSSIDTPIVPIVSFSPISNLEQAVKVNSRNRVALEPAVSRRILPIEDTTPAFRVAQAQDIAEVNRLQQQQDRAFTPSFSFTSFAPPILSGTDPINPRTTKKRKRRRGIDLPDFDGFSSTVRRAFDVEIKRGGKFRRIQVGLPKGKATKFLTDQLKRSLAATGRLVPAGTTTRKDTAFNPDPVAFRAFRLSGGNTIPLDNTFIQRRGRRLGTRSEISEIQEFARRSIR